MQKKIHHGSGGREIVEHRADRPLFAKPKVLQTYFDGETKMYLGENGRRFMADLFDRFFNRSAVLPMQGKRHKGENPNSFTELLFS